jgi:hypothetical protein
MLIKAFWAILVRLRQTLQQQRTFAAGDFAQPPFADVQRVITANCFQDE